ncbi:MAG: hypothetical protein ABFD82_11875 [Syntrophaceae bacterium]
MNKRRSLFFIFSFIFIVTLCLTSCQDEGKVITQPDEYKHIFEGNESIIIQAIAQVFKDKVGSATIHPGQNKIESDYVVQDKWRTKNTARVKKINWKECEVTLSVITEKKTEAGWEMRKILEKEQYDKYFNAIELQLYQEMYKVK